ncbi:MAG: ribonuclease R, partial [Candidatus Spyradocola sp.]
MENNEMQRVRESILRLLEAEGPKRGEQIAQALGLEAGVLRGLLEGLEEEGRLYCTRKERWALPETLGLLRGRLQGNARGFGFVIPEAGGEDLYIPADAMGGALHGDTVLARITNAGRREGEIVRVLVHCNDVIVGTFETDGTASYVVPD